MQLADKHEGVEHSSVFFSGGKNSDLSVVELEIKAQICYMEMCGLFL